MNNLEKATKDEGPVRGNYLYGWEFTIENANVLLIFLQKAADQLLLLKGSANRTVKKKIGFDALHN